VTPPHTVYNVKECLLGVEDMDESITTSLFVSPSSQTPMNDSGRVAILECPGPGYSPNEPMALVGKLSAIGDTAPQAEDLPLSQESTMSVEVRYSKCYGLQLVIALTSFSSLLPSLQKACSAIEAARRL
jgi:hypothetical protein